MNPIVRKLYKALDNRSSDGTVILSVEEIDAIIQEIERLEDFLGNLECAVVNSARVYLTAQLPGQSQEES